MKNKIKKLSALLCAVVVSCLSCVSAFAVDISNMSRLEMQQYIHGTSSTFRYDVQIPKSSIDNVVDFLDLKKNKIPAYINTKGELEEQTDRYENIVNSANCDLSDIVYDIFIFGNDEVIFVNWIYYVKSDTAKFTMDNYNADNFGFNFNEKCFCTRVPYVYNETTDTYKQTGGAFLGVDYAKMSNAFWQIPKDYTCYYYSNNAGTPAFDENGNKLEIYKPKPNIEVFYEFKDGYHTFVVDSSNKLALSFDFCEYNSNYKFNFGALPVERLEKHSVFDINTLKPKFRYNTPDIVGDVTKSEKISFEQMVSSDNDKLKIAWWKNFFNNDSYAIDKERLDILPELIEVILSDTDSFYIKEADWKDESKKMTPDYNNPDYVYAYILDYVYRDEFKDKYKYDGDLGWDIQKYYQPVDWLFNNYNPNDYYSLENRVKRYTCTVLYEDFSSNVNYKGYVEHIGIAFTEYKIPDKYIEYFTNNNYCWVVSYQDLEQVKEQKLLDLNERHFVDYFIFSSNFHVNNLNSCPYGNGIDNNKDLLYNDKDSLFPNNSFIDSNGNLVTNDVTSDSNLNFDYDLGVNINSIDDLFNSCDNFFDYLAKAFSIFPSFLWSLIATSIVIVIFLRILGR